MKKLLLVFYFLTTISASAQQPIFEWANAMGNTDNDEATSVVTDASGNVYTTGSFRGTVDFNPGAGIFNLSSGSTSTPDVFVTKFDGSGNFIWAKSLGGSFHEEGVAIDIDNSGNVYIGGTFFGPGDYDPGPGTFNMSVSGMSDAFITKLDGSGNFIWAIQTAMNLYDMHIDGSALYLTGFIQGMEDLDPGSGTFSVNTLGNNSFVTKLDLSGNFIWAKVFESDHTNFTYGLATDANGNLYATGRFTNTADFDPGAGVYNLSSTAARDVFIVKLNSSGNFLWAKKLGGSGDDFGHSIAVDVNGNSITTGKFSTTVDMNPGTATFNLTSTGGDDIFITKLDPLGNFIWAKKIGSGGNDIGSSIAIDNLNNLYTTGSFNGTADFDPNSGTYTLSSTSDDVFVSVLDASGNFVSAQKFGGSNSESAHALTLDNSNNIYTAGYFNGTVDFDPALISTFNLSSSGMKDIFLHKMLPCTSSSMINPTACISYTVPSGKSTYTQTGIYMDTIPNSLGCDSVITIDLIVIPVDTSITHTSTTLTANTVGATYQWIDCNNGNQIIPGEINQSFTASTSGNYAVIVTENSCTDTSSCYSVNVISCSGSTTLTTSTGTFESLNYSNNQNCSWLIQPTSGGIINLSFTSFDTEPIHDSVSVYEGSSAAAPLIGSFSGNSIPNAITSTGSSLYVTFKSNASITNAGWEANYSSTTTPFLDAGPDTVILDAILNSTATISVSSNIAWSSSNNVSWFQSTPASDSGNASITITATQANVGPARQGEFYIMDANTNTIHDTVLVIQNPPSLSYLYTLPDTIHFASNGGNASFDVFSDTTWQINTASTFFSLNKLNGKHDDNIQITASSNTNTLAREEWIYISAINTPQLKDSVLVIQDGQSPLYLTVNKNTLSLNFTTGSIDSLEVNANVNWNVSHSSNWISVSPMSGTGFTKTMITALSDNLTGSIRKDTLVFSAPNHADVKVEVIQVDGSAPYFSVSSDTVYLQQIQGSTANFSVLSNQSWSIIENTPWLILNPTTGNGAGTIDLMSASKNNSGNPRTATVTLSSSGFADIDVAVIQLGSPPLFSVSKNLILLDSDSGKVETFSITSNLNKWDITTSATWVDVSPISGSFTQLVSLTTNYSNDTQSIRVDSLEITAPPHAPIYVKIMQDTAISVGINNYVLADKISIYPNPVSNDLTIEFTGIKEVSAIEIEVFNAIGNKIPLVETRMNNAIHFDVSHLNNGIYFLMFSDGKTRISKTISVVGP